MTFDVADASGPLVSVLVITYNSARFVTETLDSIAAQTYPRLELIVSDDGSSDSTVERVRAWGEVHRARFERLELLSAPVNAGISANCNRALHAARGEWLKFIAGDDLLTETGIAELVDFVRSYPDCRVAFGRMLRFGEDGSSEEPIPPVYALPPREQLRHALIGAGLPAPASFLHRETVISVGAHDEAIPMIEDAPLWIRLAEAGHRFYFVDALVARYRIHDANFSKQFGRSVYIDPRYYDSLRALFRTLVVPKLWRLGHYWSAFQKLKFLFVVGTIVALGNRSGGPALVLSVLITEKPLRRAAAYLRSRTSRPSGIR